MIVPSSGRMLSYQLSLLLMKQAQSSRLGCLALPEVQPADLFEKLQQKDLGLLIVSRTFFSSI